MILLICQLQIFILASSKNIILFSSDKDSEQVSAGFFYKKFIYYNISNFLLDDIQIDH